MPRNLIASQYCRAVLLLLALSAALCMPRVFGSRVSDLAAIHHILGFEIRCTSARGAFLTGSYQFSNAKSGEPFAVNDYSNYFTESSLIPAELTASKIAFKVNGEMFYSLSTAAYSHGEYPAFDRSQNARFLRAAQGRNNSVLDISLTPRFKSNSKISSLKIHLRNTVHKTARFRDSAGDTFSCTIQKNAWRHRGSGSSSALLAKIVSR